VSSPQPAALVLADGDAPTAAELGEAWPGWDAGVALVIAADGGARHAATFGRRIDRWLGDGDSIDPADLDRLAEQGVRLERAAPDKDESDAELAVVAAVAAGMRVVIVVGGLGGTRTDHELSNVGLLFHPALAGLEAWLYDRRGARISALVAPDAGGRPSARAYAGRAGDILSLVPFGETAHGVTTEGLQFPLVREPLVLGRTRGVSNVRTRSEARVTLESGRLLVIETPVTVGP
jgi:thiamine pyrophosphokinase